MGSLVARLMPWRWLALGVVGAALGAAVYVQTLRLDSAKLREANAVRDRDTAVEANKSLAERLRLEQANAALSAQLAAEFQRRADDRKADVAGIEAKIQEADRGRAKTDCAPDPAVLRDLDRVLRGQ